MIANIMYQKIIIKINKTRPQTAYHAIKGKFAVNESQNKFMEFSLIRNMKMISGTYNIIGRGFTDIIIRFFRRQSLTTNQLL
jgi:hypothetical protein